ncbi:MAG: molybdopterin molybdotransferase MoeA [Lachnospiraceae bacterium]|nr:molybdopterin molybdotransferase MoeA [Lachnospiraceae bacterium]
MMSSRGTQDSGSKSTISWQEAQALLCGAAKLAEACLCGLDESLDRVLAEDVYAPMDQPPFRRSAMDGYAIHSRDLEGALPDAPVSLEVRGCVYAGDPPVPAGTIRTGEAVRIMTGAPVPDDTDLVVPQEDTDEGEETVHIYVSGYGQDDHICPVGEDFARGECLIEKGTLIDAYALSCACAAGIRKLSVRRKIRAGLIMTGNELCAPGEALKPGKIYNSNAAFLKGRLTQLGCETGSAVYIEDDAQKITETIRMMAKESDLIITTGGVSVGKRDLVPEALENAGADILFHGIAIKPGMPTLGAVCGGIPVLSLSGNPYSAAAIFELLGRPLICRMQGRSGAAFRKASAELDREVVQNGYVPRIMMGIFDGTKVSICGKQRNAQMKYGVGSNCVVILPPGKAVFPAGTRMEILL